MAAVEGPFSVIKRLRTGLAIAVTIVSIAATLLFVLAEVRRDQAALEEDTDKSIASLSQLLERPIWNFDTSQARLIGNVFLNDPRVAELVVREADGNEIVSVKRGDQSDIIRKTLPIKHEDRVIGDVTVAFSRGSYVAPAWRGAGITAAVFVLVVLTVYYATGLMIRKHLSRPLNEMSAVVNAYAAGNYSVAAKDVPYVEFKPFAELLTSMGNRIQAHVELLQKLNSELQQRAVELSRTNERLQAEVTERSRVELQLERNRTMIEQVLNAVPLLVWWNDINGVYLGCNAHFTAETLMSSKDDVIGKTDKQMRWSESADKFREEDRAIVASGRPLMNIEDRIVNVDGTVRWRNKSKVPLRDEAGNIYGVLGVAEDVTARKLSEEQVRQERDFSNALINSLPGILYLIDRDGRHVQVNDNHRRLTGYSDEEYTRLHMLEFVVPEDRDMIAAKWNEAMTTGMASAEAVVMTKAGERVPFFLSGARVVRDGKPYLVGMGIDITERRKAEAELAKYRNQLEELIVIRTEALQREIGERKRIEEDLRVAKEAAEAANSAKSTFLASMSHEIRTPLNAILGYTHLLKRDDTLSKKNHQAIAAISKSGEHLLDLISDILAMSRIEAGRTTLDDSDFDLHELLYSLQSLFGLRVQEKSLVLTLDIDSDLPRYVCADQRKLRQVLFNLLANAVRFTSAGSIVLRARPMPAGSDTENIWLQFAVSDTGPGISPQEQRYLFQPFAQTDSGRRTAGGAGLGLSICRGFVELMGGQIEVQSRIGMGSTFSFTIKARLAERPLVRPVSSEVVRLIPSGNPPRILVVDDHKESRHLLSQLLHSAGFETREAADGLEAVTVWDAWRPHLVWMDMNMPVLDGYKATEAIVRRDVKKETKVVALTASVFEEDRARMLASGCVDCLSKPFREDAIFDCLKKYLGVEYERRERQDISQRPVDNSAEISASFEQLSPEIRERIVAATRTLDAQALLGIVESIKDAHPAFARFLTQTADGLDFEALHQLIKAGT